MGGKDEPSIKRSAMPHAPSSHDAHDYAELIRDWLTRHLQELREATGLSSVHPGS